MSKFKVELNSLELISTLVLYSIKVEINFDYK